MGWTPIGKCIVLIQIHWKMKMLPVIFARGVGPTPAKFYDTIVNTAQGIALATVRNTA
jgi:hypothetical protein